MSKTHTPGPWKAADYLSRAELVEGPNRENLAMRQDGTAADIRLMAAAPELLAELRIAHQIIRHALILMNPDQMIEWSRMNAAAGMEGDGVTRDIERAELLARLKGGAV